MAPWAWLGIAGVGLSGAAAAAGYVVLGRLGCRRWLGPYLRQALTRRRPAPDAEQHVFLCFADHYEPKAQKVDKARGQARVQRWVTDYPRQFARFRDSDGRTPRHTFFFPAEEYEPEYLDALAGLCRQGFGEVEIHLHHHNDTADGLREKLLWFKQVLSERHGLLGRRADSGELAYAFIHGNWALCNSRPNGSWCGVNNEIPILLETGCYADFTFPSAPDPTQPPTINRIYYAWDRPGQPCSHFQGQAIGSGPPPDNALLLIPGPLVLDWRRPKWGLIPRLENSCLQASQPPDIARLDNWLKAAIQVPRRPDWYFVKLHCHGAPENAHEPLLGAPMVRFHQALAEHAARQPNFHFHYVSAREMYNLVKAAEAGYEGDVAGAFDFAVRRPRAAAPLGS